MNLFFLVEGRRTEAKVYDAWIKHVFPHLRQVKDISDFTTDNYRIFSGNGYPQYRKRLEQAFLEIIDHPVVDHFFLCLDSEELEYEARMAEVRQVVNEIAEKTAIHRKLHRLQAHIVVQHCCIETWFLGHQKMMRQAGMSPELAKMKQFYDVRQNDPELMGKPAGYVTRASYHEAYLKEMLREHDMTYSKEQPGAVCTRHYLDALRERCETTGHLGSLLKLFGIWVNLGGKMMLK